jgi:predicted ATPase
MVARKGSLKSPFLKRLSVLEERIDSNAFPFDTLRFLTGPFTLDFGSPVTIIVGENGSGKSTLIEALAVASGFNVFGGSQHHRGFGIDGELPNALGSALRLSWLPRVRNGFFLRAESFFQLASYLDVTGNPAVHGGGLLHGRSHGEAFMTMFQHRLGTKQQAMYFMDEPEAALSPQRQLAFRQLMGEWQTAGTVQAIFATHSPILMSLPGAEVLWLDEEGLRPIRPEETPHWRIYKSFLADPGRFDGRG